MEKAKSVYILPYVEKDELFQSASIIISMIGSKYKKIAKFTPIFCSCSHQEKPNYCFTLEEAQELIANGKKKDLVLASIKKYKELLKENDFVIIVGYKDFDILGKYELNIELAKELNSTVIGICKNSLESQIASNVAHKNGLAYFSMTEGFMHCSDNPTKKCSLQDLKNNADTFIEKLDDLSQNQIVTSIGFEYSLLEKAKSNIKTLVLPESDDERVLRAANTISNLEAVNLILVGNETIIKESFEKLGLQPNYDFISFKCTKDEELSSKFAIHLYELRKSKGMSEEEAQKKVKDKMYFSTLLVELGYADGMVAGANTTTATTIRPALQIIKTKPGVSTVSGLFFMCFGGKVSVFADCAVNITANVEQLASIAISSADTLSSIGIEPKVAMLSYSTGDSGTGPSVDIVKAATKLAKELSPSLKIDGPLQFDAAISPVVAKKKMPDSEVAGYANAFIFPDLNAGNIGYKAVQRASNCLAIGPVLQGLKKPVNDLSRGCNVDDIVNTILITSLQAK